MFKHRNKTQFKIILLFVMILISNCWLGNKKELSSSNISIERGKDLVASYGCISCHEIPGHQGNPETLGPPLNHWAQRKLISGERPNNIKELTQWIQRPHLIDKSTSMPSLNITPDDARAIAEFLMSLE